MGESKTKRSGGKKGSGIFPFTVEGSFREKYNYVLGKQAEFAVSVLHPKNLDRHQLIVLEESILRNTKYISIADFAIINKELIDNVIK